MDILKLQTDSEVDTDASPAQSGGGIEGDRHSISVLTLLDDVKSLENMLNITKHVNKIKTSNGKTQSGGKSVNTLNDLNDVVTLMYDCKNKNTSNAKKKSIQNFIEDRYPKDKIKNKKLAELYKNCQPQEGGAGEDDNLKNA